MSVTPLPVTRSTLARFLVETLDLAAKRPGGTPDDVLDEIRRLECVQIDPVAAVERNQHLALHARLRTYAPATLGALLERAQVFEGIANAACVIPIEDYPIFAGTRRRRLAGLARALADLDPIVRHVRTTLAERGPQPARSFESAHRVRGYWNVGTATTKATSHALTLLLDAGEVIVVRRDGNTRWFDLPEHALPPALFDAAQRIPTPDADEALLQKYLRALRVCDAGDFRFGWRAMPAAERVARLEQMAGEGHIVPLAVRDVKRRYYVLASDAEVLERPRRGAGAGGLRFLPPLDNLLWRRSRLADLFRFDYTWEVYLPAAKRRYGYYAMPILFNGRLIGRMDPNLDRERGRMTVKVHLEPDVAATERLRSALRRSLAAFAEWHGADLVKLRS